MNVKKEIVTLPPIPTPTTALSSNELIQRAIESGNIEIVGKIMDYKERWERGEARKAFDNAMAAAKAELPVIIKNRDVSFGTGKTSYKFEDLATIAKAVDPILAKHGLSYRFRTKSEPGNVTVTCIVSHKDGHSEENSLTGPNDTSGSKNPMQAIGSSVTYLQRYTLKAALGLASSADDDAQSVSGGRNELIADEQINELIELCGKAKRKVAALEKWAGVKSLADLSLAKYKEAKGYLQQAIQSATTKAATQEEKHD